jgi:hypothetical protein
MKKSLAWNRRSWFAAPALLTAISLTAAIPAQAQAVYLTADRTIAGGNPYNEASGNLFIGQTSGNVLVSGVDVDVVAGASVNGNLFAVSDSRTTVTGGTFTTPVPGFPFAGLSVQNTAQVRLVNGTFGVAGVGGSGLFTMDGGRTEGIQVAGGTARINDGLIASQNSFTILEAQSATALLEINGGITVGVVRAATGGTARVTGGNYATMHSLPNGIIEVLGGLPANGGRLAALNRSNGVGRFTLVGTGFALTNPTAGTYFDPTYLISSPGIFYTLTGTLANGQAFNASYFEEGLTIGQSPAQITFVSSVTAPEPGTIALIFSGVLGGFAVRPLRRKAAK